MPFCRWCTFVCKSVSVRLVSVGLWVFLLILVGQSMCFCKLLFRPRLLLSRVLWVFTMGISCRRLSPKCVMLNQESRMLYKKTRCQVCVSVCLSVCMYMRVRVRCYPFMCRVHVWLCNCLHICLCLPPGAVAYVAPRTAWATRWEILGVHIQDLDGDKETSDVKCENFCRYCK